MSASLLPEPDRFTQAGLAFAKLCRTMATLRGPQGCPWDQQQTLSSLKPYLLEETYEVLEAMEGPDRQAHMQELGDVLLQVVFQAEIAQETGLFNAENICDAIDAKLQRRHPHVFADVTVTDAKEVMRNWEAIKASERALETPASAPNAHSRLSGIPKALPNLLRAKRVGEKAAAVGFDFSNIQEVLAKLDEELAELQEAMQDDAPAAGTINIASSAVKQELGDVLFAVVNVCRYLNVDPEDALRGTVEKFIKRFQYIESSLAGSGEKIDQIPLDRMTQLWEEAKTKSTKDTIACG